MQSNTAGAKGLQYLCMLEARAGRRQNSVCGTARKDQEPHGGQKAARIWTASSISNVDASTTAAHGDESVSPVE